MRLLLANLLITLASADVFTDPAIFERLCHFKNDGVVSCHKIQLFIDSIKISNDELQVNHLNPVDEAMIADASCRLVAGENFENFWPAR